MFKILFIIGMSSLFNIQVFSQGKIISSSKANELFGPVLYSVQIQTEELISFTNQTSETIMFKILNNQLYILDNKRKSLCPIGFTVNSTETFSMYSVEVVKKLLTDGNNPITYIEKRNDVLTLTNGAFTLEFSLDCPPFCTD